MRQFNWDLAFFLMLPLFAIALIMTGINEDKKCEKLGGVRIKGICLEYKELTQTQEQKQ